MVDGTEAEPVYLTSLADDSVGGDTAGDGATTGAAGQWGSVQLNNSTPATRLTRAVIRFGQTVNLTAARPTLETVTINSQSGAALTADLNSFPTGTASATGCSANGVDLAGGTLVQTGTWGLRGLPYIMRSGRIDIGDGTNNPTLTIAPGVIIKSWSASNSDIRLRALRTLLAVGTPAEPIIFTSWRDDAAGGDTNQSEGAVSPNRGDWSDVNLEGANSSASRLEHVVVRYAGRRISASIYLNNGSDGALRDCSVSLGTGDGIRWDGGTTNPVIERCVVTGAPQYGLRSADTGGGAAALRNNTIMGSGLWGALVTAPTDVANNVFSGNANGLYIQGAGDVPFNGNAFTSNTGDLARIQPNIFLAGTGNTGTGNGMGGVSMEGGTMIRSGTWGLTDFPYVLNQGRVDVGDGSNNATLTIGPGVVVKSWTGSNGDIRLRALRTLLVAGTAAAPVTFTSLRDDTVMGNTNASEGAVTPNRGDWSDLHLDGTNSVNSRLEHVLLRYGGRRTGPNIYLTNGNTSTLSFVHSSLASTEGLRWDQAATRPVIEDSTFALNSYGLRSADTGGGPVTLRRTTLQGNTIWGAYVTAPVEVVNNVVTGNAGGLYMAGSADVPFSGNNFTSNSGEMVRVQPNIFLSGTGNASVSGNGMAGVVVEGGTMLRSGTWGLTEFPYILNSGRVDVGDGSNNATLTISPGVVVKSWSGSNSDLRLRALRTLTAVGTAAAPITFTSLRDDTIMGNTNASEGAVTPNRGDWSDLHLDGTNSSGSRLEHVVLRYGGRRTGPNLYLTNGNASTLSFVHSSLASTEGLRWDQAATRPVIEDSTFASNPYGLRSADTGGGPLTLRRTTLQGNTIWGAYVAAPVEVVNNVVTGNAGGLFMTGSGDVPFSGNSFTSNTGEMVRIQPNIFLAGSGNVSVSGNGMAGVVVEGGTMLRSGAWGLTDFPYILNNGRVDVGDGSNNATLTIAPGVVVKSWSGSNSDLRLRALRTLTAVGTAAAPITFTSLRDDTIMGNTNASEGGVVPSRGDWSDLHLDGANSSGSRLEHVVLRYGGRRTGPNIYLSNGNASTLSFVHSSLASTEGMRWDQAATRPVIEDSTFASNPYGLRSADTGGGPVTLRRTTLQGNTIWGAYVAAPVEVLNNVVTGNAGGLFMTGSGDVPFSGNSFTSNTGEMVRIQPNIFLAGSGNASVSGNGMAGVVVEGGLMNRSGTWGLLDFPYILNSGRVDVGDGSNNITLNIAPGVVVKSWSGSNSDIRLRVLRSLTVLGTEDSPVTFTSLRDDTIMGNTNASEGGVTPNRGDWSDLDISGGNSSGSRLVNLVVRYGGRRGANVFISNSTATVRGGVYSLSSGQGMRVEGSTSRGTITLARFTNNPVGLATNAGAQPEVRGCNIEGNTTFGLQSDGAAVVDARNNYWGHASGPFHATNSSGQGNAVSNSVTFVPFLTSPASAQPAPPKPGNFTAVFDVPGRDVDLAWTAPSSGTPVALYRITRGAALVGSTAGTSFSDVPPAAGNYTYFVTAVEALGAESEPSNTASTVFDVTPPVITISGVINGTTYNYDATPVFSVTDFSQFTPQATLNGQPFVSGTVVETSGNYALQVTAEDAFGNTSSAQVNFTVDRATYGVIRNWAGGAAGDWHTGSNWSPAAVPTPLDEVRVDANVTVTVATENVGRFGALFLGNAAGTTTPVLRVTGRLNSEGAMTIRRRAVMRQETWSGQARNLTVATVAVEPGGLITYGVSDPLGGAGLWLETPTSLFVHAGATISAEGLGFLNGTGPGAGNSADHSNGGGSASGAGHAGVGGIGSVPGGPAYGSVSAPWDHGSGGGNLTNGGNLAVPGGRGGGRIRINAGSLRVDGRITADGQSGAENGFWGDRAGGGSGGTVFITAADLQGSGRISANGGVSSPRGNLASGGGAGGRIVLSHGFSSFTGMISARGGSGKQYGGAGTVVQAGTLHVNNGFPGAVTPILSGAHSFIGVVVGSHAAVEVSAAASLSAASFLTQGRSTATNRGTLTLTGTASAEEASVLRQLEGSLSAPRLEARTGGLVSHEGGTISSDEAETISNGALSVNAPLSLARLLVRPGGLVRHAPGDADFELDVWETLTVEAGGRISADAAGHPAATGPGAGGSSEHNSGAGGGSGGGHGGAGGRLGLNPGGAAYGSITDPELLGSGGGNLTNGGNLAVPGGRGGGKIRITAGTLRVDGRMSVDGEMGGESGFWGDRAGGGSGGSIWVTADRLEGSGLISANGAAASPRGQLSSGGGAGGRVRLTAGVDAFTGSISARGGQGQQYGGAGTVLRGAELRLANAYPGALTTILPGSYSFSTVFIGSHAAVETTAGATLNAASLTAHERSTFTNRGSVTLTASASAEGAAVLRQSSGTMNAPSLFAKTGGVLSYEGGALTADMAESETGGALSVNARLELRNLRVKAGGLVTHIPGDPDFDLDVAETVTVETGGAISADELGFGTSQGPGAGVTVAENFGGGSGSGGGYGGQGGAATQPGGFPYGSMAQPIDLGSGGGGLTSGHNVLVVRGGSGGGRLRLSADTLRVDGSITANGQMGPLDTFWGDRGGGGSGGSILISVEQLQGTGRITANGGNASPRGFKNGGGGAGGRIALYYGSNASTQTVQANGGVGKVDGAPGTILDNGSLLGQAGSTGTVAFSQMEEKLSASQDLTETLTAKLIRFAGAISTGTPAGTFGVADVRLVLIKTGPFANRGFFRGNWSLSIPAGETLTGQWEGMAFIHASNPGRVVLKGVMKGRIEGVLDGFLLESVPGSGTFNRLAVSGRLVQVGNVIGASSIYVSGTGTISESVEHPGTNLNFLQISQSGEVGGYYQTPVDVAFSLVRVTSVGHPYFGEGFFNAAYDSPLGSGSGWAYAAASGANTRLAGPFEDSLKGLMEGVLTSDKPRALLMTLRNLDAGLPVQAEITTSLSFPGVTPIGGLATVIIELRNDGYAVADGVTVIGIAAEKSRFVAASGDYKTYRVTHWRGAEYTPKPFIRWDFTQVPARSTSKMSYQVRLAPSTPSSVQAGIDVDTISTEWANTIFANYNLGAP